MNFFELFRETETPFGDQAREHFPESNLGKFFTSENALKIAACQVDSSPNVNPVSMIDMGSIDPAMGNNRSVSSGTPRAIDAAGADDCVGFGHRGHHRAEREDSGDRGLDCSLHIKSPSKIVLFEYLLI
jgi:hypothetical protein